MPSKIPGAANPVSGAIPKLVSDGFNKEELQARINQTWDAIYASQQTHYMICFSSGGTIKVGKSVAPPVIIDEDYQGIPESATIALAPGETLTDKITAQLTVNAVPMLKAPLVIGPDITKQRQTEFLHPEAVFDVLDLVDTDILSIADADNKVLLQVQLRVRRVKR